MGKYRVLYLFFLLFAVFFYVLYNLWYSWYLLMFVLLFPLFDLLVSLPGMLMRRLSLSAPYVLDQGQKGILTVTTQSGKPFPAGPIKVRLHELRDGEPFQHRFTCDGARGGRYKLAIDTSDSGLTFFVLRRLWASSLMGLFSLPAPVKYRAAVLILPPPMKPPNAACLPQGRPLRPKPGGGFSEEHDIRPYRQGDPMNSVHWKLSAKHDTLIIREALEQPPHSRLVQCMLWKEPWERDLILGRLRWISAYLLEHDAPYYVRLGDHGLLGEITCTEDLIAYLHRAQDSMAAPSPNSPSLPTRFTWVFQVDARQALQ